MGYHQDILEENGWNIECESPFEIRDNETESFASGSVCYEIANSYIKSKLVSTLILIKDAYLNNIIDVKKFEEKIIETLNNYEND